MCVAASLHARHDQPAWPGMQAISACACRLPWLAMCARMACLRSRATSLYVPARPELSSSNTPVGASLF
eukprot:363985-Chlamydomonas_euryale.AAC.8